MFPPKRISLTSLNLGLGLSEALFGVSSLDLECLCEISQGEAHKGSKVAEEVTTFTADICPENLEKIFQGGTEGVHIGRRLLDIDGLEVSGRKVALGQVPEGVLHQVVICEGRSARQGGTGIGDAQFLLVPNCLYAMRTSARPVARAPPGWVSFSSSGESDGMMWTRSQSMIALSWSWVGSLPASRAAITEDVLSMVDAKENAVGVSLSRAQRRRHSG